MDPSTWVDSYGQLRHNQLNARTNPMTQNGNLHHMTNIPTSCQKNPSSNKSIHKQHQQQQMNQYMNNMNTAAGQAFMNGQYRPSDCSSWLFNTRPQPTANHDSSLHLKCHPENVSPSFNSSSFASLQHHGVYDTNFMPNTFNQTAKSNNYLSSMAVTNDSFVDQMKKTNDTNINYRNGGNYCHTNTATKAMNINNTSDKSLRDASGFFSSHSLATANGWSHHSHPHQNFMSPNMTTNTGNVFSHQQINHRVNSQNGTFDSVYNKNNCTNACATNNICNKVQTNLANCHQNNSQMNHINNVNNNNTHNYHNNHVTSQCYNNAGLTSFSNISNNSYLMPNLSTNRDSQNSFVDASISSKFATNADHYHDHYATFAFAAAQALQQQQQQQQQQNSHHNKHHQQYMSSMNNYTNLHAAGTHQNHQSQNNTHNLQTPDPYSYPNVSSNFKSDCHNNFINYCTSSIFPMTHSDVSMNATFKSCIFDQYGTNVNQINHQTNTTTITQNTTKTTKTRKTSKANQKQSQSQSQLNADTINMNSFNEYSNVSCPVSMPNISNGSCCLSNDITSNAPSNFCSMANAHHGQTLLQPNNNDSYNYNYPSPIMSNQSMNSPYHQRSSTSNSSHSSINSCALSNGSDYLNYGTPNSAPSTVFQTIGTSQTPTPTHGYPTPPSSVGHSNSRCNSNEELSPYSNNSMSSNMSHQSYSRNDFNKSTSSSSSQISPNQVNDVNMGENLQFSSCMLATSHNSNSSNQATQPQNSPNLFSSTNVMENSYNSPQFYSNTINNNSGTISNDSTDRYASYTSKESTIGPISSSSDIIKLQATNVEENAALPYDYNYAQETQNNSFGHNYTAGEKSELSTCLKEPDLQPTSSQLISHQLSEDKHEFSTDDDNFNLSFDSVIQSIDVNLSTNEEQQVQVQPSNNIDETSNTATNMIQINGLNNEKDSFQSIDLDFISTEASVENNHSNQSNQNEHCSVMNYQSSHDSVDSLIDESNSVVYNNILSLIDSLPKFEEQQCLNTEKSETNTELSNTTNSDNFLSDLAPLMNDNSKIALMESTFNQMESNESNNNETSFDKLNKNIFDDIEKIDNQIPYTKPVDDDNQFSEVDEFLNQFAKEPMSLENELNNDVNNDTTTSTIVTTTTNKLTTTLAVTDDQLSNNEIKDNIPNTEQKETEKTTTDTKKTETKELSNSKDKLVSKPKNINNKNVDSKCLGQKAKKISRKRKYNCSNNNNNNNNNTNNNNNNNNNNTNNNNQLAIKNIKKKKTKSNVESKTSKKNTSKNITEYDFKDNDNAQSTKNSKKRKLLFKKKLNNKVKKRIKPVSNQSSTPIPIPSPKQSSDVILKSEPEKKSLILTESVALDKSVSDEKTIDVIEIDGNEDAAAKENVNNTSKDNNSSETIVNDAALNISPSKPNILSKAKKNHHHHHHNHHHHQSEKKIVTEQKIVAKSPTITPLVANNSNPLLSPSILNATSCMNKSVTTLTNVTPTLIVNPNQVNPYQVSPMANILISINHTPLPSLGPQSFITLNNQNVTSSTTSNTTTTSSSIVYRRRTQEKKASPLREGLMRTGDFVVAVEESHLELPVIWRIEGKSLLQRFEPSNQTNPNGNVVYINTSSYSAWNPTVRQKYIGLDVRIMGCNRTRIVVEKIGLRKTNNDTKNTDTNLVEKESNSVQLVEISECFENFEVLMQTLISQALDSNFIAEIVKENDEYFLSHMQIIEDICHKRRTHILNKTKWENGILTSLETYPKIQIHEQTNVGDLRCRSCHDNWSTKLLYYEDEQYNRDTLEFLKTNETSSEKKMKYPVCDGCLENIFLYSKLYHYRYNFYFCCKTKVDIIQNQNPNKESRDILEECLQDVDWLKAMFKKFETIILSCDNL